MVFRLFYGKIRQRITSESTPSRHSIHEKEDLFSHLPVNVSEEGFDIYDGLSQYFDDTVEFEGNKAHMEVSLVDLPPLLQIQLQVRLFLGRDGFDSDSLSVFNLTGMNCKHSNRKHMSSFGRKYPWIGSSTTPIHIRKRNLKISKES